MKKKLYRKPVRKGKEILFYVCKIGKSNISIIITTEESLYWRIRDNIQDAVDVGSFDSHFNRGQVFCQRVARFPKDKLTSADKKEIIDGIKRNFHAISFEDLRTVITNKTATLEQFMIGEDDDNYYCEVEQLKKILPLKEVSKEDYYYNAVTQRFPEFANKLKKEHKMLADTMELE